MCKQFQNYCNKQAVQIICLEYLAAATLSLTECYTTTCLSLKEKRLQTCQFSAKMTTLSSLASSACFNSAGPRNSSAFIGSSTLCKSSILRCLQETKHDFHHKFSTQHPMQNAGFALGSFGVVGSRMNFTQHTSHRCRTIAQFDWWVDACANFKKTISLTDTPNLTTLDPCDLPDIIFMGP